MTTNPLRLFSDRAASTLAGGISPTSVTLNLTAGGGALFPNPTAPNFFAATLIDAATGLLDEIVWCTARSTDTLTVIRGQENTVALTFNAGDLFQKLLTSGDMQAMLQLSQGGVVFVQFIPQTTFFVNNSTGSDTFDGTSATLITGTLHGPFSTISHAIANISTFNLGGQTVTLQLATTGITYPTLLPFNSPISGSLVVQGNAASQSSVVISGPGTAGNGVIEIGGGSITFVGLTIINTSNIASTIAATFNTHLVLQNVTVTTTGASGTALILSEFSAVISINAGCIFSGQASQMWLANGGSILMQNNATVSGTPTYGVVASAIEGGLITVGPGATWSGSAVGQRFNSTLNAVINTNGGGINFFPGSTAGAATTGLYA